MLDRKVRVQPISASRSGITRLSVARPGKADGQHQETQADNQPGRSERARMGGRR